MLDLYFLRHGETDYNRQGIVQGSGVDSDLNENGRKQAQYFFDAYKHMKFDKIYASKLKRTHQTLAPWKSLGYEFHMVEALNEFSWGVHEGLKPTPEQRAHFFETIGKWSKGDIDATVEGAETPRIAWARAANFFEELPNVHEEGKILLCSHGRQLRIILSQFMDYGFERMEEFPHKNTSLTLVRIHPDMSKELVFQDKYSHLPETPLKSVSASHKPS